MSRDLERSQDQRVVWLYGMKLIKVSYHPAKFDGHSYLGSGDIFLVCHVILMWCHQHLLDWVNSSRCICLRNWWSKVLWKWKYQFLSHFLHNYLKISWTQHLRSPYREILKIRYTDLQIPSPGHGWEKNKKKNTCNCKALCFSCKCKDKIRK